MKLNHKINYKNTVELNIRMFMTLPWKPTHLQFLNASLASPSQIMWHDKRQLQSAINADDHKWLSFQNIWSFRNLNYVWLSHVIYYWNLLTRALKWFQSVKAVKMYSYSIIASSQRPGPFLVTLNNKATK